jgi:hypothetical protein
LFGGLIDVGTSARERHVPELAKAFGEGKSAEVRWQGSRVFAGGEAAEQPEIVEPAKSLEDGIEGGRGSSQDEDALAATGRLGDDFCDRARFAGSRNAIQKEQVRSSKRPGNGVTLIVVEGVVDPRELSGR